MSRMYLGPAKSIQDLQDRFATVFGEHRPGDGIRYNRFDGGVDLVQGDRTLECNLKATEFDNGLLLYVPVHEASWPEQGTYEIANEQELPSHTPMPSGFGTLAIGREGEAVSLQYGKRDVKQGLRDASEETRTQRELETILTYNISHKLNVQFSKTETRRTYRRDDTEGKVTNRKSVVLNWYQGEKGTPSVTATMEQGDHIWEANYNSTGELDFMTKYLIQVDSHTAVAHVNFNRRKYAASLKSTFNDKTQEQEARDALQNNFGLASLDRINTQIILSEMLNDNVVLQNQPHSTLRKIKP
jgi:hypothetical protein